jgi:hypothetical protein
MSPAIGNPLRSKVARDSFALGFTLCQVGCVGNIVIGQMECPLGLFEYPRIYWPRLQLHAFAHSVHQERNSAMRP